MKFANKYYERDIEYAFEMNRFFFRILGIWPFARTNSVLFDLIETVSLVSICFFLLLCEFMPILLYVFLVLKDMRLRLKVLGNAIFGLVAIIKYGYVLLYKNQVRSCMLLIDEDWRNVVSSSDRNSMIDRVRIGKRLIVMCAVFVYMSGVGVRMAMPLATGKIITPQNITIRPLPSAAYFVIFDVQCSPAYEIVYCIQFFAGFIKYTITVATFGLVTLCVTHFCAQLDILLTLMDNFVNENQFENLNKKLAIVVEHQIKTHNFLQLIQNIIQYPSLVEVLGSTIMVCFAGFYIIMEWEDRNIVRLCTYSIALVMFCFNVFIYCYMGEQVVVQGDKVAIKACTLDWYRLPTIKARALTLIIAISDIPIKLSAGKFIDLSLRTFGNVVKMSVTYLNLLRTVD